MAIQNNTPTENESSFREIKRNSSNQIVSYTLQEDSLQSYDKHRVPAITSVYDKTVYNRTLPRLSGELNVPLPDIPLTIVQQNFINESKLYSEGVANTAALGFEDNFSGFYELTPGAPTFRTKEIVDYPNATSGMDRNTHFINPSSYSSYVKARPEGFSHKGYATLEFDKVVKGPSLEKGGGYRITQELLDSGKGLQFRFFTEFTNRIYYYGGPEAYTITYTARIVKIKKPTAVGFADLPITQRLNYLTQVYDFQYMSVGEAGRKYLQSSAFIPAEDLELDDVIAVEHKVGTGYAGVYLLGDSTFLEVNITDDDNPPIDWPDVPGGSGADPDVDEFFINSGFSDTPETDATSSGA